MIKEITVIAAILSTFQICAQNNGPELGCLIEICNSDNCGDVQVSFKPSGENVFCEGAEVFFENTSSTRDFDFFIFSWGDGQVDTVDHYNNLSHTYNLNAQECESGSTFSLQYCYAGFKFCETESFSCSWQSGVVSVILRPEADFTSNSQLCIENRLQFTDKSCYSGEVLWDFGDGTTSTAQNPVHEYASLGAYTVTLTTSNECGSDTKQKTIRVVDFPELIYDLDFDISSDCTSPIVSLVDRSTQFSSTNWMISRNTPDTTWCFTDSTQTYASESISLQFKEVGEYFIRLEIKNACAEEFALDTIVVLDNLDLDSTHTLCRADENFDLNSLINTTNQSNSVEIEWIGDGVIDPDGIFNPGASDQSEFIIEVRQEHKTCSLSQVVTVTLVDPDILLITHDSLICFQNSFFELTSNIDAGIWSGPGVNASTGRINLIIAGSGEKEYNYTILEGTTCEAKASVTLTIEDVSINLSVGEDQNFCEGQSQASLIGATPSDGIWTGPGLMDSITGIINLDQLEMDVSHSYEYCLVSENIGSCRACTTKIVRINSNPVAGFNLDSSICLSFETAVQNTSTNAQNYQWNFGNGMTSTATNPKIVYDERGTFAITLVARSQFGCVDSSFQEINIAEAPQVSFTLESSSGCEPFEINILNQIIQGGSPFSWTLGDEIISGDSLDGLVVDNLPGDTILTLKLVSSNSCGSDNAAVDIEIFSRPHAGFGFDVDEGCTPLPISFANTATGTPESYLWNLGNGVVTESNDPDDQVYINGTELPIEIVISQVVQNQCGTDSIRKTITVNPPNVTAFIGLDTLEGCPALLVNPENFSTPGSRIAWDWYSDNTEIHSSIENSPLINLSEPGLYTIVLSASQCGTDTDTARVEVFEKPKSNFDAAGDACTDGTMTFTNSSEGALRYQWSFNDTDGMLSSENAEFGFNEPGLHIVKLVAFNEFNCADTIESSILINELPGINVTIDPVADCPPIEVVPANNSDQSLNYVWTSSNGNETSFDYAPSFMFDSPGDYFISLRVRNEFDCYSDTSFSSILVYDVPVSSFSLASSYCIGLDEITATNLSEGALAFEWFLGNNLISKTENMEYAPVQSGAESIGLVAYNEFQCSDSSFQAIDILDLPFAEIGISDQNVCADESFVLFNAGSDALDYQWFISGVGSFSGSDIEVILQTPGIYDVSLTLINGPQCKDSVAQQGFLTVHDSPVADFSFEENPSEELIGEVQFINTSENYDRILWNFGDGSDSQLEDQLHVYAVNRPISVSLTAFNDNGGVFTCTDESVKPIEPEYITTFFAPNALSPDNGSAEVRVFKPSGIGITEYQMSIYSPWGESVWFSDVIDSGRPVESWDGTLPSGANAPQGVYVYKASVTFESGSVKTYKGSVHLIR